MHRLILGCGFLGSRVAALWRAAGDEVTAVTRSARRAAEFAWQGIRPCVADILAPQTLHQLPAADTVLFAVGYDRAGGASLTQVYVDGWANVLAALPAGVGRLLYISSTGVYGQTSGEILDESAPCRPTREGGRACLAAERRILDSSFADRAVILRLAGIYGPGRVPRQQDIAAGLPLALSPTGYLNLIHVDDAAEIVVRAAAAELTLPQTFNVSDGHPVLRGDYYAEIARLLQAPAPTYDTPDPAAQATLRAGSDKRINSGRMVAALQPRWQYPSYREGLAAILGRSGAGDC